MIEFKQFNLDNYVKNNKLYLAFFMYFCILAQQFLSKFKNYISYTSINTPFPPLNNVPKRGFSL